MSQNDFYLHISIETELLLYTHFVSYILREMVGSFHSLRLLRLISYFSSTTLVPGESLPKHRGDFVRRFKHEKEKGGRRLFDDCL